MDENRLILYEKDTPNPPDGSLSVWWIPQELGKGIRVAVKTQRQGKWLLEVFIQYHLFLFNQKLDPPVSAWGLDVFEEGVWRPWFDAEGNDIDAYTLTETGLVLSE